MLANKVKKYSMKKQVNKVKISFNKHLSLVKVKGSKKVWIVQNDAHIAETLRKRTRHLPRQKLSN